LKVYIIVESLRDSFKIIQMYLMIIKKYSIEP